MREHLGRATHARWIGCFNCDSRRRDQTMKWVTRERPVIDRIACPWLIS
ncbi:chromate resistance protein ChrB domain-containing protein, partial [Acinetobacter baumannii]